MAGGWHLVQMPLGHPGQCLQSLLILQFISDRFSMRPLQHSKHNTPAHQQPPYGHAATVNGAPDAVVETGQTKNRNDQVVSNKRHCYKQHNSQQRHCYKQHNSQQRHTPLLQAAQQPTAPHGMQ